MSKPRGKGPITPFFYSPPSPSLRAPSVTVPILGHPSLEESYLSLANWSGSAELGKGNRGGAPARKISFVSLVAYGPKVSHSALAIGGYSC